MPDVGALLNNSPTTYQHYGYWEMGVSVDRVPGFSFEISLENVQLTGHWPPQLNIGVSTDGSGNQTLQAHMHNGSTSSDYSQPIDGTQQHDYGIDWEAEFITFYFDNTKIFQVPNPGGVYQTDKMFAYLYTGGNYSSGTGVNPPASSLPANAHIDYFRVYDAKPQTVNTSLSIAAGNANQAEGNSGSTPFTFTVTRSGDTTGTSSVAWAVTGSGGSPANAADFAGGVLPSGTLSFAAGQTSQTITVNVAGDTTVEADEGFTVTLSNPSAGTTIGTAAATGTILNDDALASQLSIAAGNASQAEGNSGSTPFTFTVTRSGDTTGTSSVAWAVTGSGGSPANAADFAGGVLPSGTLSFAAGQTSQTITVNVAGDTTVEPDEGFTVTLSEPSAGTTIGTAAATGTILNDDALASQLSIAAGDASQAEGNSGSTPFTFTVTRSGDTTGTSSVAWAVTGSGGSPANAADFAGGVLPSGTLSFAAGQTSQTITVNVAGDTTVEPDEGFTVTLYGVRRWDHIGTAAATGTILNDDALASQLSIAAGDAQPRRRVIPAARRSPSPSPVRATPTGTSTVAWAVTGSGGSPANAADFAGGVLPSGTLNFAAGQTSQTITVNVAGDTTVEADEGFTVTLSNPSAGTTIGTAAATGTILNDDALASQLSIVAGNASQAEGNSGSTPFTFTVTRSGGTTGTSSMAWAVTGSGGSPANAADFTGGVLPSGTLSFAAGQTSQTITVNVAGDTTVEADDGFTVTLSNPSAGTTIGTAAATGTILNDDALASQLSIAAGNVSRAEGNSGSTPFTFTVTRSGDTTGTSSVAWAVTGSGGSPANAADFAGGVLPSGTLSFAAGQTSQTITVNVAGDTTVEADEGFTVTLSNPSAGTTIGTAAATGTILNDDALASQLSIAAGNVSRAEGNFGSTPFTFTVTRSGGTTGTSSVAWAVTGSGAAVRRTRRTSPAACCPRDAQLHRRPDQPDHHRQCRRRQDSRAQ